MRIERDKEHDLLYIELRAGEVKETLDLDDGVHLDVDAEGNVLGVEFIHFEESMREHAGELEIPERIETPRKIG